MLNLKFANKEDIIKMNYFIELNIELYEDVKILGKFPYHTYRLYDNNTNSVSRKVFTDIENTLAKFNRIDNKYLIVLETKNYAGGLSYVGIYLHDDHARLGYEVNTYYIKPDTIKEERQKKLDELNKNNN